MAIILNSIYKNFFSAAEKNEVLHGISISFMPGIKYVVTGRSGSGKSTLLHIIAGFESPSTGTILYPGAPSKDIGFMFQEPYLLADLSVLENIILPALIHGIPESIATKKALDLLQRLEILHKQNDHPAFLSGGQQQRVALARALIHEPAFLLADEPTSNLDEQTTMIILSLLKEYQKHSNLGLIICSHDPLVIEQMDIILQLKSGLLQETER